MNKLVFPAPRSSYTPTTFAEQIWIPITEKGKPNPRSSIPALYHPCPSSKIFLIYSHGNGCDCGEMYEELKVYSEIFQVNVIGYEYPGYGIFPGEPSASSVKKISKLVFYFVHHNLRVPSQNIVLFGRSIGSGPASYCAAQVQSKGIEIGALILQSPFTSIREMARLFVGSIGVLAPNLFNNIGEIRKIRCPTLLIHGVRDTLIPHQHSELLRAASGSSHVELFLAEEADHNLWSIEEHVLIPVRTFLKNYLNSDATLCSLSSILFVY
eukprot:TRINITY_DN3477_c0_g1_i1.p1 TRINITY_DN3477_c0_g1~~TRINITY_DN3477_c0_g1_i1.p1  ORF type:complete len:268 (-),score=22.84 TRINITY_DN3477_c0_g1_i1:174-977(-)